MRSPFSNLDYSNVLKGVESTEISNNSLSNSDRIDAENYQHYYIDIEKKLQRIKCRSLGSISKSMKKGIFDIKASVYQKKGIPFVRISNLNNMLINKENIVCIPESVHYENHKTALNYGDIILSKTAYAAASFVNLKECNTSQDTVAIKINESFKFSSAYLVVFLNSHYGFRQMKRWFTGNVQMHLNLTDSKNILIPELGFKFQKTIDKVFNKSISILENSEILYKQAIDTLMSNMNLLSFEFSEENINEKRLSNSFNIKGRLDAEYYQKKYDQLYLKLKSINCKSLGNLVSIYKSIEPGSAHYKNSGIPFVRVSNLSKFGLTDTVIYLSETYLEKFHKNELLLNKIFPKKNTILFSKDGSVGVAYKLDEECNIITSSAITHLTIINENEVLSDYLTLVLNSPIVQMQAERDAGGSIIQHWRIDDIEDILIPILDISTQLHISNLVRQSFLLRRNFLYLNTILKQSIEKAIEENEEIAIKFVNHKFDEINHNLELNNA